MRPLIKHHVNNRYPWKSAKATGEGFTCEDAWGEKLEEGKEEEERDRSMCHREIT